MATKKGKQKGPCPAKTEKITRAYIGFFYGFDLSALS